jgi:imidazole glycerol phosphate synthase glutamine amidotransferase subunit
MEGALDRLGFAHRRAASPAEDAGGLLLLPGVGHFGAAKRALKASGWWDALPDRAQARPLLGVCLGLQLLAEGSEESGDEGLGLLQGTARRLGPGVKVPHMGWSRVKAAGQDPAAREAEGSWLYFVHSYALDLSGDTILSAEHGRRFTAMAGRGGIRGFQPHPEKSGADGLRILKRTLEDMMEGVR